MNIILNHNGTALVDMVTLDFKTDISDKIDLEMATKSIEEINDFIVNRILLSSEVINKLPDNYIYNEND